MIPCSHPGTIPSARHRHRLPTRGRPAAAHAAGWTARISDPHVKARCRCIGPVRAQTSSMTQSRIIIPCLLAAGIAAWVWQTRCLAPARSRADPPSSPRWRPPCHQSAKPRGTAPVSLASLTHGLEETADVSEGSTALAAELAENLESLTPAQRRAVFAEVTRQLNHLTEAELKARTSGDPERRRAMLLIPALVGLLQRSDPLTVLAWSIDPELSVFWNKKVGRLAAETLAIYAKTQPAAALDWMQQNADGFSEPDRAWYSTLAGIAAANFPLALQEAKDRGMLAGALESMVPALTTPESRKEWIGAVSGLDDGSVRARNWSGIIRDQVQTQGWEQACTLLQADLPVEAMTPDNLRAIAKEALTRDPVKFVDTLPPCPKPPPPKPSRISSADGPNATTMPRPPGCASSPRKLPGATPPSKPSCKRSPPSTPPPPRPGLQPSPTQPPERASRESNQAHPGQCG